MPLNAKSTIIGILVYCKLIFFLFIPSKEHLNCEFLFFITKVSFEISLQYDQNIYIGTIFPNPTVTNYLSTVKSSKKKKKKGKIEICFTNHVAINTNNMYDKKKTMTISLTDPKV